MLPLPQQLRRPPHVTASCLFLKLAARSRSGVGLGLSSLSTDLSTILTRPYLFSFSPSHHTHPRASPCQDILTGQAKFEGPHKVKYGLPGRVDVGGTVTARDIIIATGSVPFVPPGASLQVFHISSGF